MEQIQRHGRATRPKGAKSPPQQKLNIKSKPICELPKQPGPQEDLTIEGSIDEHNGYKA